MGCLFELESTEWVTLELVEYIEVGLVGENDKTLTC